MKYLVTYVGPPGITEDQKVLQRQQRALGDSPAAAAKAHELNRIKSQVKERSSPLLGDVVFSMAQSQVVERERALTKRQVGELAEQGFRVEEPAKYTLTLASTAPNRMKVQAPRVGDLDLYSEEYGGSLGLEEKYVRPVVELYPSEVQDMQGGQLVVTPTTVEAPVEPTEEAA